MSYTRIPLDVNPEIAAEIDRAIAKPHPQNRRAPESHRLHRSGRPRKPARPEAEEADTTAVPASRPSAVVRPFVRSARSPSVFRGALPSLSNINKILRLIRANAQRQGVVTKYSEQYHHKRGQPRWQLPPIWWSPVHGPAGNRQDRTTTKRPQPGPSSRLANLKSGYFKTSRFRECSTMKMLDSSV